MQADTILAVDNLTMRFGGLSAVKGVSAKIARGSIAGLIGPNGAGKTTCFNMITGFYKPTEGTVLFKSKNITGSSPNEVCNHGIARTFQNIRLFRNCTVLQNVMTGTYLRQKTRWWQALCALPASLKEERELCEKSMELLKVVGLQDMINSRADSLPYGPQRRLEIARALATQPEFLLLDEPAAGMNPNETEELMGFIHDIRDRFKLTVLLIEHDMKLVMNVCEQIWVLDHGELIANGPPEEIQRDPKVIKAYLGEETVADA